MGYRNYPLSNPEGQPIPTEVLGLEGMLDAAAISSSAMGAAITIPGYDVDENPIFIEVWATVDCQIGFTATPVDGSVTKGIYHLRADDPRLLYLPGGYISAVATSGEEGLLYVNILTLWGATKKDNQTETEG